MIAEYGHELVGLYEVMMNDYEVCTVWATSAEDHVRAARPATLPVEWLGGRATSRATTASRRGTHGPVAVHPVARGADDPARRHAVPTRGRTPRRQRVGRLSARALEWKCIKLSPSRPRSGRPTMDLTFRSVDADNHYYEALDSCTRYLDPAVQATWGADRAAGQKPAAARRGPAVPLHPQPDVRPHHRRRMHGPDVPRPDPRGRRPAHADGGSSRCVPSTRTATAPPARSWTSRTSKPILMFPTLGCGIEQALPPRHPGDDGHAARLQPLAREDWGFSYQDRLVTAPMISLADPETALAELDDLIARGARTFTSGLRRSPGQRGQPLARRRAPRPGLGPPRRGVDPGRLPPG